MKFVKVLLIGFFMVLFSCGKGPKVPGTPQDDKDNPGNAQLLTDASPNLPVEGLGITIGKIKIWKSTGNTDSPGDLGIIEQYAVEFWFSVDGDTTTKEGSDEVNNKIRYAKIAGMLADDEGNLYWAGAEPGTTFYKNPRTNETDTLTKKGLYSYTVSSEDGLIQEKYPAHFERSEVTGTIGDTSTVTQIVEAPALKKSGWENAQEITFGGSTSLFSTSHVKYEQNKNFETTAKMGCVVKPTTTEAAQLERTFIFGKVELGNLLQDKKDAANTASSTDQTKLGDDDGLWIKWDENWFITGVNHKTHKLRMIRARSAPFYSARELPGVDISNLKPNASGIEKLARACNKGAANATGYFRFMYFDENGDFTVSNQINYNASVGNATSDSSIDLTDNAFGLTEGTWNGTAHLGPVTDAGDAFTHYEQSAITEVEF